MSLTKAEIARLVDETTTEILGDAKSRAPGSAGVPTVREIRKRLSVRLKRESAADVHAVGLGIAAAPSMKAARARWVGLELIARHKGVVETLDVAAVEALGAGNSSWDEVDGYGIYIAGPAWLKGVLSDADIRRWAKSDDLWRRRAALVATVVLNSKTHGGHGDARRTLMVAEMLIDDREDMVIKAMSWALRMLVSWDRAAVERFIADHEPRLAARIKREVRLKLTTGKKNQKKHP